VAHDRLTELETRYTFLERHFEELSQVLHEQQRTIEALAARVKHLEAIVAEAIEGPEPMPHEKPPHY
jgi:uncharacterized coiled-coil protein SlyX